MSPSMTTLTIVLCVLVWLTLSIWSIASDSDVDGWGTYELPTPEGYLRVYSKEEVWMCRSKEKCRTCSTYIDRKTQFKHHGNYCSEACRGVFYKNIMRDDINGYLFIRGKVEIE